MRCKVCGANKPLIAFMKNAANPSGHQQPCKACRRERDNRDYAARRARIVARRSQHEGDKPP